MMKKCVFIIFLLIIGGQVYADEVSKMSIIDGDLNEVRVDVFNFERLESEDKTTIIISSSKKADVSCSFFDKNNRPVTTCLLYTSPSPRDRQKSRMPSSA